MKCMVGTAHCKVYTVQLYTVPCTVYNPVYSVSEAESAQGKLHSCTQRRLQTALHCKSDMRRVGWMEVRHTTSPPAESHLLLTRLPPAPSLISTNIKGPKRKKFSSMSFYITQGSRTKQGSRVRREKSERHVLLLQS